MSNNIEYCLGNQVWEMSFSFKTFINGLKSIYLGFPCSSAGKESASNARDLGLIHGMGRSPGEGKGYQLQSSGLENSMDCTAHGVTELDTTE